MDDGISRGDLPGNFAKESLLRQGNGYKSVLSGKSTPRSPHTFRRLHSSRTPRRGGKIGRISLQWFRSNKLVYWLLLITLWTYIGFYVQSRWAHGDDTNRFLGFGHKRSKLKPPNSLSALAERRNLLTNDSSVAVKNGTAVLEAKDKLIGVVLASKGNGDSNSPPRHVIQKKVKKPPRKPKGKALKKQALKEHIQSTESEERKQEIPKRNTSYGLLVGPFGATEDRLLKWSPANKSGLLTNDSSVVVKNRTAVLEAKDKLIGVVLASKGNGVSNSPPRHVIRKKDQKPPRKPKGKALKTQALNEHIQSTESEEWEPEIPKRNTSYGLLVGPFGATEDRLLKWSPENRSGTCDRKGDFARLVWSRRFLLIFHELSMTGAPLSMMELATELLSCGATVSAVVLSKKGGLMQELSRRRIKVLEDKADFSFKVGMKSDVVIAGSAVSASWIDQYIEHFPAGGSQIVWWIMENREEYFLRAKIVLGRVKMLIFLSESQSKQWLAWCERERIKLRLSPSVVPLSVNDELAFVAGIPCSLNTPSFTPERMLDKQKILRDAVRAEMGLRENDMLLMTLNSINPGKGQLLLLESARSVIENASLQPDIMSKVSGGLGLNRTNSTDRYLSRALLQGHDNDLASGSRRRKILINNSTKDKQALKVLIGSVGSKSNKIPYVRETLLFVSQHPNLSQSVRWTPATTRVSSLYSAADVYIINSQDMGETFGRVTIEAMAFGLPVLGTDAGGTKEIVENNKTGLLHPVGHPGNEVLARNIQVLLENPSMRQLMGIEGRKKVEKKYLKRHMYKQFAAVLSKCMR